MQKFRRSFIKKKKEEYSTVRWLNQNKVKTTKTASSIHVIIITWKQILQITSRCLEPNKSLYSKTRPIEKFGKIVSRCRTHHKRFPRKLKISAEPVRRRIKGERPARSRCRMKNGGSADGEGMPGAAARIFGCIAQDARNFPGKLRQISSGHTLPSP